MISYGLRVTNNTQKDIIIGKSMKRKLLAGRIFAALVTLTCILVIMIISANQNDSERRNWAMDFIKSLFQDLIFTPVIFLFLQYIALKIILSRTVTKRPKLRSMLSLLIDDIIWNISVRIMSLCVEILRKM